MRLVLLALLPVCGGQLSSLLGGGSAVAAPADLADGLYWPAFAPGDLDGIPEDAELGAIVKELRFRLPGGKSARVDCESGGALVCATQAMGNGNYQVLISRGEAELEADGEAAPKVALALSIGEISNALRTSGGSVLQTAKVTPFRNETLEFPILDANDNAPEFQPDQPEAVAVPVGGLVDSEIDSGVYVRDVDAGENSDVAVVCEPAASSPPSACDHFNVAAVAYGRKGVYKLKLYRTATATAAAPGTALVLALRATDMPLDKAAALSTQLLLPVDFVGADGQVVTAPPTAPPTTSEEETVVMFELETYYLEAREGAAPGTSIGVDNIVFWQTTEAQPVVSLTNDALRLLSVSVERDVTEEMPLKYKVNLSLRKAPVLSSATEDGYRLGLRVEVGGKATEVPLILTIVPSALSSIPPLPAVSQPGPPRPPVGAASSAAPVGGAPPRPPVGGAPPRPPVGGGQSLSLPVLANDTSFPAPGSGDYSYDYEGGVGPALAAQGPLPVVGPNNSSGDDYDYSGFEDYSVGAGQSQPLAPPPSFRPVLPTQQGGQQLPPNFPQRGAGGQLPPNFPQGLPPNFLQGGQLPPNFPQGLPPNFPQGGQLPPNFPRGQVPPLLPPPGFRGPPPGGLQGILIQPGQSQGQPIQLPPNVIAALLQQGGAVQPGQGQGLPFPPQQGQGQGLPFQPHQGQGLPFQPQQGGAVFQPQLLQPPPQNSDGQPMALGDKAVSPTDIFAKSMGTDGGLSLEGSTPIVSDLGDPADYDYDMDEVSETLVGGSMATPQPLTLAPVVPSAPGPVGNAPPRPPGAGRSATGPASIPPPTTSTQAPVVESQDDVYAYDYDTAAEPQPETAAPEPEPQPEAEDATPIPEPAVAEPEPSTAATYEYEASTAVPEPEPEPEVRTTGRPPVPQRPVRPSSRAAPEPAATSIPVPQPRSEQPLPVPSPPPAQPLPQGSPSSGPLSIRLSGVSAASEGLGVGDVLPDFSLTLAPLGQGSSSGELVSLSLSGEGASAFRLFPSRLPADGSTTAHLMVLDSSVLDFEAQPPFLHLQVRATGTDGALRAEQLLRLRKTDVKDSPPVLAAASFAFAVRENSLTGTAVGMVPPASHGDDEEDAEVTQLLYSLSGDGADKFEINYDGAISVACPTKATCLDRERRSEFRLIVLAEDPETGLVSQPADLLIRVEDDNDNRPVITASAKMLLVHEGELSHPVVVTVKDSDAVNDAETLVRLAGDAATFLRLERLPSGNEYRLRLERLPLPGLYDVVVEASEPGAAFPPTRLPLKLTVTGFVSTLKFKRPRYERTVTASKLVRGNPLLQVELEGQRPVEGGLSFVIMAGNPGWLALNGETGLISVGEVPPKGVEGQIALLRVAAMDSENRRIAETQFQLTVLGPRIRTLFPKKLFLFSVPKTLGLGEPMGHLRLSRTDVPVEVVPESFSAVDGKAEPVSELSDDSLTVESDGRVSLNGSLSDSGVALVQFAVRATDDAADQALVVVHVEETVEAISAGELEASAPAFPAPWSPQSRKLSLSLPEGAPRDYVLAHLPPSAPHGRPVTNVTLEGPMAKHFRLDALTGRILVRDPIDLEAEEEVPMKMELTLRAVDMGLESFAYLDIDVISTDDNPPEISALDGGPVEPVLLEENARPGTVVLGLRISDADVGDAPDAAQFTHRLTGHGSDLFQVKRDPERWDVVSVVVAPGAALDYERETSFGLLFSVTDAAGNTAALPLLVQLSDLNDNVPQWDQPSYEVEAVENVGAGTRLLRVTASDLDSGPLGNVTYSIVGGNEAGLLAVNASTGVLYTRADVVAKGRTLPYVLTLQASDQGTPRRTTTVQATVFLLSAAVDGRLSWASPSLGAVAEVEENAAPGTRVVAAALNGNPHNLRWSLGGADAGRFSLDSVSGVLFTKELFDAERRTHYSVVISVEDETKENSKISRLLAVRIVDLDDNAPAFVSRDGEGHVRLLVTPSTPTNSVLGSVVARDADSPPHNAVRYALTCGNDAAEFAVDQQGAIRLAVKPQDLTKRSYVLCLEARPEREDAPADFVAETAVHVVVESAEGRAMSEEEESKMRLMAELKELNNTVQVVGGSRAIALAEGGPGEVARLGLRVGRLHVRKGQEEQWEEAPAELRRLVRVEGSGRLRASPVLAQRGTAMYRVELTPTGEAGLLGEGRPLLAYLQVVEDSAKLRFLFRTSVEFLRSALPQFQMEVEAFVNSVAATRVELRVDAAERLGGSLAESSVCFYAAEAESGRVLSEEEALALLTADTNTPLSDFYLATNVTDIQACLDARGVVSAAALGGSGAGRGGLGSQAVLFAFGGLLLVMTIGTLAGYLAYLRRYAPFMIRKRQYNPVQVPSRPQQSQPPSPPPMREYEWKECSAPQY